MLRGKTNILLVAESGTQFKSGNWLQLQAAVAVGFKKAVARMGTKPGRVWAPIMLTRLNGSLTQGTKPCAMWP